MEQRNNSLKTAVDTARLAAAAGRIARAASMAGLKGAATVAAKESLPIIIKFAIGIFIAVVLVPMLVFIAMPNVFFGYDNSELDTVMDMTEKALTIGGAYISLEDFEKTQIDSIITSVVNQYENEGTIVNDIEVVSSFDNDDLLWMIAINSVAHQQDLNAMTVQDIRSLCSSKLKYIPSLNSLMSGSGVLVTTVKIEFDDFEPEAMMEQLGFDEEAQTWAGALYEVLKESNALETYAEYYEPYKIDYSGDNSYDGRLEHGTEYGNDINISDFKNLYSKNNYDLAQYTIQAWENNWGYVWGTFGNVLTDSLLYYKQQQYPQGVGNYASFIRENWLGRRTADCIGLIKGYGWLDPDTLNIVYGTNGMPDYGADQMYYAASESGSMDTMPEIVGLALWKNGHIGVYIGNGYAIEAMGTMYGVVKTEVAGRGWQGWCKIPFIEYTY